MKRLSLMLLSLALAAPLGAEKAGPEITQNRATSNLQEISKKPLYVYTSRGRRDPFVFQDLDGGPSDSAATRSVLSVAELRLVGFIGEGSGRLALFKQGNSGVTYTLKLGHLYSPEGVQVPNVRGSIQKDDQVLLKQGERDVVFSSFKTNQ
jgi:hypothetical protein